VLSRATSPATLFWVARSADGREAQIDWGLLDQTDEIRREVEHKREMQEKWQGAGAGGQTIPIIPTRYFPPRPYHDWSYTQVSLF